METNEQNKTTKTEISQGVGIDITETNVSSSQHNDSLENKDETDVEPVVLDTLAWNDLKVEMIDRFRVCSDEMLEQIKEDALIGCSDTEIASGANISRQTYYSWCLAFPLFKEFIEHFREDLIRQARKKVSKHVKENYDAAIAYLRAKRKREFGTTIDAMVDDQPLSKITFEYVPPVSTEPNQGTGN